MTLGFKSAELTNVPKVVTIVLVVTTPRIQLNSYPMNTFFLSFFSRATGRTARPILLLHVSRDLIVAKKVPFEKGKTI
jgi:hypothetical protein